ncbi:unnamed protein product [Diatraea saccharalis]|uniref:Protein kinase C-binding protein 1-like n=1 Tax=Diatraea saccharalis TaxID=40085 RepID=A0A9N9QLG5_9NEOP|nr:unnamed protein product [Diatraea saccharalis]
MEESSEVHMETDVSSTTEDVSETQEVTGSNGNVEMIVIVEKVSEEEEDNSSQQIHSQPPVASSEDDTSLKISPHISPTKLLQNITQSPSKVTETQKTPVKSQSPQSPHKVTPSKKAEIITLSPDQSEAVVDSSSKIEAQKTPDKTPVSISTLSKNDKLDVDSEITPHASPEQEQSTSDKDQPVQLPQTKCNKETESQETVETTSTEEQTEQPEKLTLNGQLEDVEQSQVDISDKKSIDSQMEATDKEAANETMSETQSETSEKEHNKSISRELKSLINSAKESKIISECTQLTSKTRKSRAPLDTSSSSLNMSVEADKILDKRRSSDNSQKSNCSEKSDKIAVKRSMRSQNPEFVNKVKQFLNSVTSKVQKQSDDGTDEELEDTKSKDSKSDHRSSSPKRKKVLENVVQEKTSKLRSDPYCWRCHWAVEQAPNEKTHPPMTCTVCPRVYHYKCLSGLERNKINIEKNWVCPECMAVLHAESSETRSPAMKKISLGKLCELLKYAMERMMDLNGIEPFMKPVDRALFPDYDKYIVHPMDLTLMKQNILLGHYGSTEAFIADAQWILHNSIIFNTCEQSFVQSKLTAAARTLVRSCRAEMGEIEACPECYAAAHALKPTWFTDVCTTPHILLWAKLKGFPYWPAKGMSVNSSGLVDVRFFGAHDRAWVPAKDCFLFSVKDPNNFRTKRQDILDSVQEAEQHIRNISRKYGKFVYPPFKTQFDPTKLKEQLKMMIPSFEGEVRSPLKDKSSNASPSIFKEKSRSNSKSSKGSHIDGDLSEFEEVSDVSAKTSRKMEDGAEIAREEEPSGDKDKTMEVDKPASSIKEVTSRKRRRSEMEEAVITIIDSCSSEKKKRIETVDHKADEVKKSSTQVDAKKDDTKITPLKEKDNKIQSKDNEPSSSTTEKEKPTLTPIKLVISTKPNRSVVVNKPSSAKSDKITPVKMKQTKLDKSISIEKASNKDKAQKRRSSKNNKSLNNSSLSITPKADKASEKRGDKSTVNSATTESVKENKEDPIMSTSHHIEKAPAKSTASPRTAKDKIQFDDDTSLAVIARESKTNSSITVMPTISSVRSLSTTATKTSTTSTKTITNAKSIEITIDTNTESSMFSPTSVESVRNAKETANKLQRLRKENDQQPIVGRVGVKAFARMTSPDAKKDNANANKDVQVEIKSEPVDVDDADRHMEKMDFVNAFRLQPVNTTTSLREVRINKVTPPVVVKKVGVKPSEVRPRAKKTFPQPKKPDDGRSELNSKNSMVYIPIQPPVTPVPVRGTRMTPVSVSNGPSNVAVSRIITSIANTSNNGVNTVTSPLVPPASAQQPPAVMPTVSNALSLVPSVGQMPSVGPMPSVGQLPSVGPMPTNVHTVPLITSVNGQWTFSLQPVMSVGGVDVLIQDDIPQPLMNGLPDRSKAPTSIVPIVPTPVVAPSNPVLVPASTPVIPPTITNAVLPSSGPNVVTTSTVSIPTVGPPSVVTPNRTTENSAPGEPPRLQQRPALLNPLDTQTPAGALPTPSSAGPITAKLNQNAVKMADFFRNLLEDSLEKVDEPAAEMVLLKLQLEQNRWRHRQELEELKHNHELTLAEMRSSFEKEKARLVSEVRVAAQADLESAVKAAKTKQWCANCNQEAQFYCCWNTSYCDYPCQRAHWSQHFSVCTQQRTQDGDNNNIGTPPESRLQPQPDNLPKSTTAPSTTPTLTVGGKIANRGPAQETGKTGSIIINMEKDNTGNQKLKCVGTYKVPGTQSQISPLVLNKQIMNNEENSKKVVTSGGYLIVGHSSSSSTIVSPPRRTHSIHYYT